MILALVSVGCAIFIYYCLSIVYMVYFGANYVATPPAVIQEIMGVVKPGDTVVDLGFGRGEVLEAALTKRSRLVIGYELDVMRYLRVAIRLWPRYRGHVQLVYGDVRLAPLADADLVFTFFSPHHITGLYAKAKREMKQGSWFVSYMHPVIGVHPTKVRHSTYYYQMNSCT